MDFKISNARYASTARAWGNLGKPSHVVPMGNARCEVNHLNGRAPRPRRPARGMWIVEARGSRATSSRTRAKAKGERVKDQ